MCKTFYEMKRDAVELPTALVDLVSLIELPSAASCSETPELLQSSIASDLAVREPEPMSLEAAQSLFPDLDNFAASDEAAMSDDDDDVQIISVTCQCPACKAQIPIQCPACKAQVPIPEPSRGGQRQQTCTLKRIKGKQPAPAKKNKNGQATDQRCARAMQDCEEGSEKGMLPTCEGWCVCDEHITEKRW